MLKDETTKMFIFGFVCGAVIVVPLMLSIIAN